MLTLTSSFLTRLNPVLLIFCAAMFYVGASYIHLGMKDWTFAKAIAIAIPLVLVEYTLSLNGNKIAHKNGWSSSEIMLMTMCFYFIGVLILNKAYLGDKTTERDFIAVMFVLAGFYLGVK